MKHSEAIQYIPKLPEQDKYLLQLQNDNYSMQTILNYARDLSIFAVFLKSSSKAFDKVNKEDITLYKGWLRNGEHIKELDNIREFYVKGSEGSRTYETNPTGITTPWLEEIYSKVFGSVGISGKPANANSRTGAGLDARSINRMLSAVRSYLKYRIDMDLDIPVAPDAIKLIKAERKKSQVAEFDELVKLIECPTEFEHKNEVGIRNRCMLELLFSTGMRISELINLNLDQVNAEGKLFVLGKGKKQRFVYLTERAMDWLDRYLLIRLKYAMTDRETSGGNDVLRFQKYISEFSNSRWQYIHIIEEYRKNGMVERFDSPALFIPFSGRGKHKKNYRISTNYFQERIAEYRRRLGIMVPTSAHSLRHGFATYLAENGASPAAIQHLLGHESLNTTTRYVHASDRFAEETHKDKHPLK